jgi:hypothetical protein
MREGTIDDRGTEGRKCRKGGRKERSVGREEEKMGTQKEGRHNWRREGRIRGERAEGKKETGRERGGEGNTWNIFELRHSELVENEAGLKGR